MRLMTPVSQGVALLSIVSAISGYTAAAIAEAAMVIALEIVVAVALSNTTRDE